MQQRRRLYRHGMIARCLVADITREGLAAAREAKPAITVFVVFADAFARQGGARDEPGDGLEFRANAARKGGLAVALVDLDLLDQCHACQDTISMRERNKDKRQKTKDKNKGSGQHRTSRSK